MPGFMHVLSKKTTSVIKNFGIWGQWRVDEIFRWSLKEHIFGWFHMFQALVGADPFTGFLQVIPGKRYATKSHREAIGGEFFTWPHSTKIGTRLRIADITNHIKFGNDLSREYKIMDGRISSITL